MLQVARLAPRSLGESERAAADLGFSKTQATALQKVASDELSAAKKRPAFKAFTPVKLPR